MKTKFGTARVDWREPPALWVTLGWVAAVLWPPLPVTWILWPATQGAGALLDWRVIAAVMGGAGVAATFFLIERERRQHGQPRSRFGVVVRFIAIGFLFSIACALLLALVAAVWTAIFATGDIVRRLAEFKASLIVGLAFTPAALIVGVSYSLWAGVAAAIIAFTPRSPSVRPKPFMMDQPQEARSHGPIAAERLAFAAGASARAPALSEDADGHDGAASEPMEALFATPAVAQPESVADVPSGPHPETELEAALRPDWLEHG